LISSFGADENRTRFLSVVMGGTRNNFPLIQDMWSGGRFTVQRCERVLVFLEVTETS
jgi:hypothetical protein